MSAQFPQPTFIENTPVKMLTGDQLAGVNKGRELLPDLPSEPQSTSAASVGSPPAVTLVQDDTQGPSSTPAAGGDTTITDTELVSGQVPLSASLAKANKASASGLQLSFIPEVGADANDARPALLDQLVDAVMDRLTNAPQFIDDISYRVTQAQRFYRIRARGQSTGGTRQMSNVAALDYISSLSVSINYSSFTDVS
jgi:hypothetical protein